METEQFHIYSKIYNSNGADSSLIIRVDPITVYKDTNKQRQYPLTTVGIRDGIGGVGRFRVIVGDATYVPMVVKSMNRRTSERGKRLNLERTLLNLESHAPFNLTLEEIMGRFKEEYENLGLKPCEHGRGCFTENEYYLEVERRT